MGAVFPKVKVYLFLSVICILINLCVFMTVLISTGVSDSSYIGTNNKELSVDVDNNANLTVGTLAVSTGSAFLPFASIVSLVVYFGDTLPTEVTIFTGLILGIISAIQITLLSLIIINYFPKILGSGFDV